MSLRQELHDETVRLQERAKYNRALFVAWSEIPELKDEAHEIATVAHIQETIVIRLQSLLDQTEADEYQPSKENKMNTVKSLAGTGKDYCQFQIEVSGGDWGQPKKIELVDKVSGGCGGYATEKRTPLTDFALPVNVPNGKYTLQAKIAVAPTSGGCGGYAAKGQAHVQFPRPAGTPTNVKGNRDYGWAFETNSAELIAALLK